MEKPYVILFAKGLNGLGGLRSANHAGFSAFVLVDNPTDLSVYSRLSCRSYLLPSDPKIKDVLPVLDRLSSSEGGPGVLMACSDSASELLSELKEQGYARHHIIVPSIKTTRVLNDKRLECRLMAGHGIALPRTYYRLGQESPSTFPILIKPRTHKDCDILGAKNVLVHSREELDVFCSRFQEQVDRFIGQQVIDGRDDRLWVCNVTYNLQHELSACFVFSRLGTMPSHYGVTSLAISCDNPKLRAECAKIGKALRYCGPAMIEFKQDPETGIYYYLETNPRLGMCNWFDTQCGVNNIQACVQIAYGNPVASAAQKNNIVYWNFFGDLVARLENRETIPAIARRYLRLLFRPRIGAVFYWKDPVPAAKYCWDMIRTVWIRVGKRLSWRKL